MAESVSFVPVADDVGDAVESVRAAVADPRLSRSNFFDGRLLTAEDLVREQVYLDGRLREVGLALGHGVASGLVPQLVGTRLGVTPGVAVTPAGRVLVVDDTHPVEVDLGDRARLRQLNDGLYARLPGGLYAIVLAAAETTSGAAEAFPTDLGARRELRPNVVVEGVELLLVRLDLPLPRGAAVQARAQLAPELAGVRPRGLGDDQVPLGLLAVDNDRIAWLDTALCRHALRLEAGSVVDSRALAEHWESLAPAIASYRLATGQSRAFAARDYLRLLPPAGDLPKDTIDPQQGTQKFFPGHWDVRLAPLRSDDWEALRREALEQEPLALDDTSPASVLVLALLDPSLYGAYVRALEAPRRSSRDLRNFELPLLDALRLRLTARLSAGGLDTDAQTWSQIWPLVPEGGVKFVRRRALSSETGESVLVLAQGADVPRIMPADGPPVPAGDTSTPPSTEGSAGGAPPAGPGEAPPAPPDGTAVSPPEGGATTPGDAGEGPAPPGEVPAPVPSPGVPQLEAFAAVRATRMTRTLAAIAKPVIKALERAPELKGPAAQCFLSLCPGRDAALWSTLAELLDSSASIHGGSAAALDSFLKGLKDLRGEQESQQGPKIAILCASLGVSARTADLWVPDRVLGGGKIP